MSTLAGTFAIELLFDVAPTRTAGGPRQQSRQCYGFLDFGEGYPYNRSFVRSGPSKGTMSILR